MVVDETVFSNRCLQPSCDNGCHPNMKSERFRASFPFLENRETVRFHDKKDACGNTIPTNGGSSFPTQEFYNADYSATYQSRGTLWYNFNFGRAPHGVGNSAMSKYPLNFGVVRYNGGLYHHHASRLLVNSR